MTTDLAIPMINYLSLSDFPLDGELAFEPQEVLDVGVLSLDFDGHDVTDDDVMRTLNCLFDSQFVVGEPSITVAAPRPVSSLVAKRALYRPTKRQSKQPPAKRPRTRKRTPEKRDIENKARKAKVKKHAQDRAACIEREAELRNRVRHCIAAFAFSLGFPLDATILRHLPRDLRLIMWRSDVAMKAYTTFTNWGTLCETVNGLGSWW